VDIGDERGAYFQLKVELKVSKPLRPGIPLKRKEGGEGWLDFKYERLASFCYGCGRMGHDLRLC